MATADQEMQQRSFIGSGGVGVLLLLALAASSLSAQEPAQEGSLVILPYFLGNGETGVYLSASRDGLHFEWLYGGKAVLSAPDWEGENLTRDPSILYRDGRYHMVWTTGWNTRSFGYASSPDLRHWSSPQKIDIWPAESDVRNTWAPEIHWDPQRESYLILWSSTTQAELSDGDQSADEHGYDHRPYATWTRDFKAFSPPKLFYQTDPEISVIDPFLARDDRDTETPDDDRWIMVIKNEMPIANGGKNLRLVEAPAISGPYSSRLGPPIVGAGTAIVDTMGEGPSLFRYRGLWHLYWDAPESDFSYCLATSPDLEHWTNRSAELRLPAPQMRHGTVFLAPRETLAPELFTPARREQR